MNSETKKQGRAFIEYLRGQQNRRYNDGILERNLRQAKLAGEWWIKHVKPGKFPVLNESTRKA